jgi:anti-sigma factor RsiW
MSDHDALRDAAGPWVLGALDEDESWRFASHLEVCATCRAEVDRLRMAADALPLTAPPIEPPPELKDRLMAIVEEEARDMRANEPAPAAGAAPRAQPSRLRTWLDNLFSAPALATGAAALLLVAGGVIGFAAGGDGDVETTTVAGEVQPALGGARAELVQTGDQATLRVSGMPEPPAGRVWQVWVMHDGTPQPDAVFTVDREGRGSVGVIGDVSGAEAVLVTSEPRGGRTTPSGRPVISATPA